MGRATSVATGSSLTSDGVLQRGLWEWMAQQGQMGSTHSLNASSQAAGEQLESSWRAAGEQLESSWNRAAGEQLESSWNRAAGGQLESRGAGKLEYELSREGRTFIALYDPMWYVPSFYEKTSYVWGLTHRAWNKLCHTLWGNTKLRVATFNANGLQTPGAWRQFLTELDQWVSVHRVSVVILQEHNWHPDTEGDRKAEAAERRATLTIGFAAEGGSGVHWGGVAILTYDDVTTVKSVAETSPDLVSVTVEHGEHVVPIVGVYAPAQPAQRVSFFQTLGPRIPDGAIVGGDWNCVADVTVDVQGPNALSYANVGGILLSATMGEKGLADLRREQLGARAEHTRVGSTCLTRLDRWYVPVDSDVLFNIQVKDDLRYSDHLPVILELDWAVGERGHERRTIREDLMYDPVVLSKVRSLIIEVYAGRGNREHKWAKWTNMVRDYLIKQTDAKRKRNAPKVRQLQMQLAIIRAQMRIHGPQEGDVQLRAKLHGELRALASPEVGEPTPDDHHRAAQKAEQCSAPFFKTHKDVAKQQWINQIKRAEQWEDGEEPTYEQEAVTEPKQIPHELAKYYTMLLGEKVIQQDNAREILDHMKHEAAEGKGVTPESKERLEQDITDDEIYDVMLTLPLGKQAGPDRIPNIVFKLLPKLLAPKLGSLLREAIEKGSLPMHMLQGDIGLLFKKGERDEVRNYRPITLLQGAYKIFTRVLTRRMMKVVHEFVDEGQKGFVPHTVLQDATYLLHLVEQYINDDCINRKGLMVFLDMEKAFDRVSYEFLLRGLEAVGFGPTFIRTIKLMYDTARPPKRRIYANGYYSDWFDIKSGVAQGCPISPLLFLIVAQALRVSIDREGVKGISIGDVITMISQFADDTTLVLQDTAQLKPAFKAINKWCAATGMRENLKKREGLALGSYRTQSKFAPGSRTKHKYVKSIKWAQEGEWVISLGVPIGNDLDHATWWRKKIEAVRIIANKWKNISRRGYFGRSLVTQAMYYGRYRFWLWSLAVPKSAVNAMQVDADRLLWAKDPILNDLPKRVRRCVAHRTAIGPRTRGGLNEMLWSDHVKAIQAQVIMRYLHPAKAAWKEILDVMLLRNKKGEELFGAGRGILMCPLSVGQKTKLLSNLPKRSVFFKDCIRAHWQRGYKQDLSLTSGLSAETLWHNPRFQVECEWRVRHYFVNVLSVTQISDIVDYETDQPFDDTRWAEWIQTYHRDSALANLRPGEVDIRVQQIRAVVDQVPRWIIDKIAEGEEEAEEGELVALMTPDAQDEGGDVVEYATLEEDEDVGTRFRMHIIDAVGKEHPTGERACILDMNIHKVAWWGDRVQGPLGSTFPLVKGWKVGETEVELHEVTVKNTYREFVRRKFKTATAQEGWSKRLGVRIPWSQAWRCNGCYSSPRDRLTMMKLMRRNLFTAQRNPETDGVCLLCSQQESQLHLVECGLMFHQYWAPLVLVMRRLGFTVPLSRSEINAMLITFRVTDTTVVGREQATIIEIGWRCLYAALVRTRVDGTPLTLKHAVLRCLRMVHSRVTAYGRKWELWMFGQRGRKEEDQKRIPEKYQKRALIKQGPYGDYVVEPKLGASIESHKDAEPVVIPGTRQRRRAARHRPPTPPGGGHPARTDH